MADWRTESQARPLRGIRARCCGKPRGGSGCASRMRPLPPPVFLTLSLQRAQHMVDVVELQLSKHRCVHQTVTRAVMHSVIGQVANHASNLTSHCLLSFSSFDEQGRVRYERESKLITLDSTKSDSASLMGRSTSFTTGQVDKLDSVAVTHRQGSLMRQQPRPKSTLSLVPEQPGSSTTTSHNGVGVAAPVSNNNSSLPTSSQIRTLPPGSRPPPPLPPRPLRPPRPPRPPEMANMPSPSRTVSLA
ncbi:unnamed protein product [Schistocephalus solidus]|uniref:Abi_HHR domain-containing protein n=1 Tax=Schistocephalus solidus TaxID=70667 RepID=A0A183TRE1_SCHSO|nr:unnamed protein product [Schistocephalus solidus]